MAGVSGGDGGCQWRGWRVSVAGMAGALTLTRPTFKTHHLCRADKRSAPALLIKTQALRRVGKRSAPTTQ